MVEDTDWRLQGQQQYLQGAALVRSPYRRYQHNPNWDHDHCEFCGAKFMAEDVPDTLREGYCTEDEYRWICESCFVDFKDRFAWTVKERV